MVTIVLDQVQQASLAITNNTRFIAKALGLGYTLNHISRTDINIVACTKGEEYPVATSSLVVQALHMCFAEHLPFCLRPELAWYMIVHEVGMHVKINSVRYEHLFTQDFGEKKTIIVRDDSLVRGQLNDWGRTLEMFRRPLRAAVTNETAALFLVPFSTATPEDETVLLVALMDAASPYYRYRVETKCGVPQIKLEGKLEDWERVAKKAEELQKVFPGLKDYFANLVPTLWSISDTVSGGRQDHDFWSSIYKYQNESGGPIVTGWITNFFAHKMSSTGPQMRTAWNWCHQWAAQFNTDEFPAHVSKVPFIWDYYGTDYPMVFAGGVFGIDYEDGFITPRLGFGVFEATALEG